jgi:hypothetical protein
MRFLFLLLLIVLTRFVSAQGQDFGWWNKAQNWDGVTHWREYIRLSPKFMGPNALPVTPFRVGSVPSIGEIELRGSGHFSNGDNTEDLFTRLFLPIANGLAGFELRWTAIEHYKNDIATRDLRGSREEDGEGLATGDVWVTTYIQLLKNHEKLPNMLLSINLKTASGTGLHAARYTDAPGYSFDLSIGRRDLSKGKDERKLYPFAMAGFYAWQTYSADENQDDAFLYGLGMEYVSYEWIFQSGIKGYIGYRNNGDRPMIASLGLERFTIGRNRLKLSASYGIFDFKYTSVQLSLIHRFKTLDY